MGQETHSGGETEPTEGQETGEKLYKAGRLENLTQHVVEKVGESKAAGVVADLTQKVADSKAAEAAHKVAGKISDTAAVEKLSSRFPERHVGEPPENPPTGKVAAVVEKALRPLTVETPESRKEKKGVKEQKTKPGDKPTGVGVFPLKGGGIFVGLGKSYRHPEVALQDISDMAEAKKREGRTDRILSGGLSAATAAESVVTAVVENPAAQLGVAALTILTGAAAVNAFTHGRRAGTEETRFRSAYRRAYRELKGDEPEQQAMPPKNPPKP